MRMLTAGESHGKGLSVIIDGCPANLEIDKELINLELKKRQSGYGRGARQKIESDVVEITSGIRGGMTTGAPITLFIKNKDYDNWKDIVGADASKTDEKKVTALRPGHGDYSGCVKYNQTDARNILERASARGTAAQVAAGAVARQLLSKAGIFLGSHTVSVAGIKSAYKPSSVKELCALADVSVLRCADPEAEKEMVKLIDYCKEKGDTAGGRVEAIAEGMPVGIGSHTQFDRRLDFLIAGHIAAIQAVKCVGFGIAEKSAEVLGSMMHDEMFPENGRIVRHSNNAGGIEAGISNGEIISVCADIKPIPTLMSALKTVDIETRQQTSASTERSDVCAVPAAGVVVENVLAWCLATAVLDTLGGDHMDELLERIAKKREAAVWL